MRGFCSAKASLIFSTRDFGVFGNRVAKHLAGWPLGELVGLAVL